jgi:hypothetical protein
MEIKDALRTLRRIEWPTLQEKFCPEVQSALTDYVDAFVEREHVDDALEDHEYDCPRCSEMSVLEPYWIELSRLRKIATARLVDQLKAFRALNIAMYGDHPALWEDDPATTAEYSEYIDSDGEAYDICG